jgi:hypothetical protein
MATASIGQITYNTATRLFTLEAILTGFSGVASGVFRVYAPDNTYYYSIGNSQATFTDPSSSSAPDITDSSLLCVNQINIPKDVYGETQMNDYRFELSVSGFDSAAPTVPIVVIADTYDYQFVFVRPLPIAAVLADNYSSIFSVIDNTNYSVNGVLPTNNFAINGTILVNTNTITNISDTSNLDIGMFVTGTGIPFGTTILSKDSASVLLSNSATIGSVAYNFIVSATYKQITVIFPTGIMNANVNITGLAPELLPNLTINNDADVNARTYQTTNNYVKVNPAYVGEWSVRLDATLTYYYNNNKVKIIAVLYDLQTYQLDQTIDLVKQGVAIDNIYNNYATFKYKHPERARLYLAKWRTCLDLYLTMTAMINGGNIGRASYYADELNIEAELNNIVTISGTRITPINSNIGNPIILNQS